MNLVNFTVVYVNLIQTVTQSKGISDFIHIRLSIVSEKSYWAWNEFRSIIRDMNK